MKFIRDMMGRKSKDLNVDIEPFEDIIGYQDEPAADRTPAAQAKPTAKVALRNDPRQPRSEDLGVDVDPASEDMIQKLNSRLQEVAAVDQPKAATNIWDMDGEAVEPAAVAAAPAPSRRRRNKTRVLGFNGADTAGPDAFETAEVKKTAERTKFPCGWMLVAEGPGRGECFTLEAGMSQIGRGEGQAIQLDFGDTSISRENHAAVVYDTETHSFTLGHGGKKNIVRLNGKPVISNETLTAGDKIKIGETILHFVPLCTEEFNWSDEGPAEENEDVAIA